MRAEVVTLSLCGDVMLGRGIDQILPHPVDPTLREAFVHDARTYVALAEQVNGSIPRPVDYAWPWGDALEVLDDLAPDLRVLNLETSITAQDTFAPHKGINYRMAPRNLPCLTIAAPDACVLSNNHILDFERPGLEETLDLLADAGVATAGAGRDLAEARRPVVRQIKGGGRVLVFAIGTPSSGVPLEWAATTNRPGVHLVAVLSGTTATDVIHRIQRLKQPTDIVVVSIHWGSNWGYQVEREQIRFAHTLIDGGVDLVHGHSSHHPRPIEVYENRLILYGCGDFINDYEGITGYAQYRDELRLLYIASLRAGTGELLDLQMIPFRSERMRLRRATQGDAQWLRDVLDTTSRPFNTQVALTPPTTLTLQNA